MEDTDDEALNPTHHRAWQEYLLHSRLVKSGEPVLNPAYNLHDISPPFQPPPFPQPRGWFDRLYQSVSKGKARRIFEVLLDLILDFKY